MSPSKTPQRAATIKVRLTPGRIESAHEHLEGRLQVIIRDTEQPGLGLRVTAGGKAYIFQGKLVGQVIRMTLDDAEAITLTEARDKAAELRAMIRSGRDPRIVKAEVTAADEAKREKTRREQILAAEVWPLYMAHCSTRQKRPWSARTREDHERLASPGGTPKTRGRKKGEGDKTLPGPLFHLLQQPLMKIDAEAVETWLKENSRRPAVAEFGFVRLRAFMRWCARQKAYREQVSLEAFVSDDVKAQVPELKAKTDRLRRVDLMPWFQEVNGLLNRVHAAYLQITLLTGCRRGELAPLRWESVDFRHGTIRLEGKTGVRMIPMPPYIRALLLALQKLNAEGPNITRLDGMGPEWKLSPFVFPSEKAKSGYIEEPRYSHEKALKAAGLPHVSINGLRRTFGSMSDSVGVDLPHGVVLQIQGHKPQGVAEGHYRVRELEELAPWHAKYEAWILAQACIEQPRIDTHGLKVIAFSLE